jgi:hypothetical protein
VLQQPFAEQLPPPWQSAFDRHAPNWQQKAPDGGTWEGGQHSTFVPPRVVGKQVLSLPQQEPPQTVSAGPQQTAPVVEVARFAQTSPCSQQVPVVGTA